MDVETTAAATGVTNGEWILMYAILLIPAVVFLVMVGLG